MPTRAAFLKRPRLLLLVIVAAAVVLCLSLWVDEGPLWRAVCLRKSSSVGWLLGHRTQGYFYVKRWRQPPARHGIELRVYEKNGLTARRKVWVNGAAIRSTEWDVHGHVHRQSWQPWDQSGTRRLPLKRKDSSPWWWGVTDQTEPTMPGWKPKR